MITVHLLKSYCIRFMLYAVEAVSLSNAICRVGLLENCIHRALYKIFGPCDELDFLRSCIGLDYVKVRGKRAKILQIYRWIYWRCEVFYVAFSACFKPFYVCVYTVLGAAFDCEINCI